MKVKRTVASVCLRQPYLRKLESFGQEKNKESLNLFAACLAPPTGRSNSSSMYSEPEMNISDGVAPLLSNL